MIHIKGCEGGWDVLVHLIVTEKNSPPQSARERQGQGQPGPLSVLLIQAGPLLSSLKEYSQWNDHHSGKYEM